MTVYNKYQQAALVWLEQNPGKTLADCRQKEDVVLANQKPVHLGMHLSRIRRIYRAMQEGKKHSSHRNLTEEEILWWTEHGMEWGTPIRNNGSLYQQIALVWLEQHPGKTLSDCPQKADVVLENGEPVHLGMYLYRVKRIYQAMQEGKNYRGYQNLSKKEINWWMEHGLDLEIKRVKSKEFYQQAALVWLERNPGKTLANCPLNTVLVLDSLEEARLGEYLLRLKGIYQAMQKGETYHNFRNLTKKEILWWTSHGMDWEYAKDKRHNFYQNVALAWLEQNPGKTLKNCDFGTCVLLSTGDEVELGDYLQRIQKIYQAMQQGIKYKHYSNLTEEEVAWWTAHGFDWNFDLKYQAASLVWLEQHPSKTLSDCRFQEKVLLHSGKTVHLGRHISQLRKIYLGMQSGENYISNKILSKEEIAWWTERGINWHTKKKSYSKYQTAALIWLEQNPGKTLTDCDNDVCVFLEDGTRIKLGQHLDKIRRSYRVIKSGKKISSSNHFTEKDFRWWDEHGLDLNVPSYDYQTLFHTHRMNRRNKTFGTRPKSVQRNIAEQLRTETSESWLVDLYNQIIREFQLSKMSTDEVLKLAETTSRNYLLTLSEQKILYKSLQDYLNCVKDFQIRDVGLEGKEDIKLSKIQEYGLDEFDIEESFFAGFQFEKDEAVKKKLGLFRTYIIDWNCYSEEEKKQIQLQNDFTEQEFHYIQQTREDIDQMIEKVHMLRR